MDLFFSKNPNPMWIYDPSDLSIQEVNQSAVELYGYSHGEMCSITIEELRSASEVDTLKEHLSKDREPEFNNAGVWHHQKKNGDDLFVRVLTNPVSYEGNDYKLVVAQDVTSKIDYQQKYEMLFENSLDGIMLTKPNGDILQVNTAACEILGMTEEEIIDKGRDGIVAKDEKLEKALEQRSQTGKFSGELTYIHKSGRPIPVEVTSSVFINYAGEKKTSLIFRDISERKRLEELLNQTNRLAKIGSWEYIPSDDGDGDMYWSEVTREILEVDQDYEPSLKSDLKFYDPESRKRIEGAVDKALNEGIPFDEEVLITTAKGNQRWIRCIGKSDFEDGECVRMYGSFQDIHDQKVSELELADRKEFIETTLDNLPIGIAVNEIDSGKTILINKQFSEIYGWPEEELSDVDTFFENVYPDKEYRNEIKGQILEDIESGDPSRMSWKNIEITTQESEKRIVNAKNIPLYDQNQMISTVIDVTAEKEAEEERVRVLERIGDAFFAVDNNWTVTYWNKRAEQVLEMPREKVLGKNLWEVYSDAVELDFYTQYHKAVEEQVTVHFEEYYPTLEKWFEVSAYPSKTGLSVYFRDITRRKNREKELKESVKEKEVLLMEIHHRVKNNLAVVSGMMQLQAYEVEDPELQNKLYNSVSRIQTIAAIHEVLYQSKSFSKLQVDETIKKLISIITENFQGNMQLETTFELEEIQLNINQAIPCSLIVNEVVTNVLKHAYEDREKGNLSVEIFEEDNMLNLKITDDGKGLPDNFDTLRDEGSSLGLTLIDTLANQLDAEYEYFPLEQGASFSLCFEIADTKGTGNINM
jgi:PAS domain S-box-containing protein